jgi:hypothetical protein
VDGWHGELGHEDTAVGLDDSLRCDVRPVRGQLDERQAYRVGKRRHLSECLSGILEVLFPRHDRVADTAQALRR